MTTAVVVCLLQTRFGTQLQAECFKPELHARRRIQGESLQSLYQDICRLVTLAYPSAEASLVTHVGKETFIAVLSDGKLELEVMKQEPQNMEAALRHTIKLCLNNRWPAKVLWLTIMTAALRAGCVVCTVAGPSEVDETAALHKLIRDVQDTLAQATRVMAAISNGLWNGHTTPSENVYRLHPGCCFDATSTSTWTHGLGSTWL